MKTKHRQISIIGMPGTLKTTSGQIVAQNLEYRYVDTDNYILQTQGMSPHALIEKKGQDYFRDCESAVIESFCMCQDIVLSLGGGAVLRHVNMQQLCHWTVVWLDSNIDSIYTRLVDDNTRPLLCGDDKLTKISQLAQTRLALYEKYATIKIDNSNMSSDQTANAILYRLK